MWEIWTNELSPKALKSCPKSNKSFNLVTLVPRPAYTKVLHNASRPPSSYVRCPSQELDAQKTVFVGALHGMLNAEGLYTIFNDLFGGVVYSSKILLKIF